MFSKRSAIVVDSIAGDKIHFVFFGNFSVNLAPRTDWRFQNRQTFFVALIVIVRVAVIVAVRVRLREMAPVHPLLSFETRPA